MFDAHVHEGMTAQWQRMQRQFHLPFQPSNNCLQHTTSTPFLIHQLCRHGRSIKPLAIGWAVLQVLFMVLDEADKLLAMGFAEQVDALLAAASNRLITRALFSATLPDKVNTFAAVLYHEDRQLYACLLRI